MESGKNHQKVEKNVHGPKVLGPKNSSKWLTWPWPCPLQGNSSKPWYHGASIYIYICMGIHQNNVELHVYIYIYVCMVYMQIDRPWQLCGSEEVRPFQIAGYINSPQKLDCEILGAYDSRPEMADDCYNIAVTAYLSHTSQTHTCEDADGDHGAGSGCWMMVPKLIYMCICICMYIYIIYILYILSCYCHCSCYCHHVAHYLFLSTSLVIIRYKWWLQRAPGGVLVLRTPATCFLFRSGSPFRLHFVFQGVSTRRVQRQTRGHNFFASLLMDHDAHCMFWQAL